jgi:hypothetical protein
VGSRRIVPLVFACACLLGAGRLWSDALAPEQAPFSAPYSAPVVPPSVLQPVPETVLAEPAATRRPPHVTHRTKRPALVVRHPAPGTPQLAAVVVRRTPPRSLPAPSGSAPVPKPKPSPKPTPPRNPRPVPPSPKPVPAPPVVPPVAAVQPLPTEQSVTAQTAPSTPSSPPAPTPPSPAPAVVEESRPGNGYGDDNHDHTGPPGQQGRQGS